MQFHATTQKLRTCIGNVPPSVECPAKLLLQALLGGLLDGAQTLCANLQAHEHQRMLAKVHELLLHKYLGLGTEEGL